jgi:hypothetical protein
MASCHQQDLAEKQAEIDHLHCSLTGVLGQLANFEGVAEILVRRSSATTRSVCSPGMTTNRLTWSITGVAVGGGSEMGWRLRG